MIWAVEIPAYLEICGDAVVTIVFLDAQLHIIKSAILCLTQH